MKVRYNTMFCPQVEHRIPTLQCLNPPNKLECLRLLYEAVADGIKEKDEFILANKTGLINLLTTIKEESKVPGRPWLLLCLAAVAGPDCVVFQRQYSPPKKEAVANQIMYVENGDGFWDDVSRVSKVIKP